MLINIYSVRLATIVQNVLTVAKIFALVIIVLGGFVMLGQGIHFLQEIWAQGLALLSY